MKHRRAILVILALLTVVMMAAFGMAACTTSSATLVSISVDASGAKTDFEVGDTFTAAGLKVTAVYDDESKANVPLADCEISSPDMATAGSKTVTVTYKEKTASYGITVNEKLVPVTGQDYNFSAVKGFATVVGGHAAQSSEFGYITDFTKENNASVGFRIISAAAEKATLSVNVGSINADLKYTDVVKVWVNGVEQTSSAKAPRAAGIGEVSFGLIKLMNIDLIEGENNFLFQAANDNYSSNFESMTLTAPERCALRWAAQSEEGVEFKGIDEHTIITGGFTKNTREDCVGVKSYEKSTLYFPIDVSKATTAKFSVIISSLPRTYVFTERFEFRINGYRQTSEAITTLGTQWSDYKSIDLGEFELEEGLNVISFTDTPVAGLVYNIRSMTLEGDATFAWHEGEVDLPEFVDPPAEPVYTDYTFDAIDDHVAVTGGVSKNENENCIGTASYEDATITFPLKASAAGTVKLAIVITSYSGGYDFSKHFTLKIAGEEQTVDAQVPSGNRWQDYMTVELGTFELAKGENEIVFEYHPIQGLELNFRSLTVSAESEVVWFEPIEGPTDFTFKGTDSHVEISDSLKKNAGEDCIGSVQNNYSAGYITFTLDAQEACTVKLTAILTSYSGGYNFSKHYKLTLNGEEQTVDVKVPGGAIWTEYLTVVLGESFAFTAGKNVVRFDYTPVQGCELNFRSLVVTADKDISWFDGTSEPEEPEEPEEPVYTDYTFNAVDDHVAITGGVNKNKGENCIGTAQYEDSTILFPLNAAAAGTVKLTVVITSYSGGYDFSKHFTLKIGGTEQTVDVKVPSGNRWVDYMTVELGTFELAEGKNELLFEYKPVQGLELNFRSLTVSAESEITWFEEPVTATDYTFKALDDHVTVSENMKKSTSEDCLGTPTDYSAGTITFTLNAQEACTVKLTIVVTSYSGGYNFSKHYKLTINGVEQTVDVTVPGGALWTEYKTVVLGEAFALQEGKNTITFEYTPVKGLELNFRSLTVSAESEITWSEEAAESNAVPAALPFGKYGEEALAF